MVPMKRRKQRLQSLTWQDDVNATVVIAWQIPPFCNCGKGQLSEEATINEHFLRLMYRRRKRIQTTDVSVFPSGQDLHAGATVLLNRSPMSQPDKQCTYTLRVQSTLMVIELWVTANRVGTHELRRTI